MIITRKKKIPLHWAFYAQLPLLLSIYGNFVINAPFLLMMKKFIDNPAAIMGLISIEVYVTIIGGPFISWLSDRIWTRWGRRKMFLIAADGISGFILLLMPFAPNLIALIVLRWLYGIVRDLGSPTQALAYEVVPAPQRGRSSGFFSASIQFGNLIFFFLVLGRFDDVYFMGPFKHLMEVSGGTIMFWLAATLLIGIAVFEALGFKEIKPPDRKHLNDGRKRGELLIVHFVRAFYKDVFGKDLFPLYLLLILNTMFGVSLGIFQPLLFTEQWGYSLQDMGNTVAVGVIFAVALSLVSGWIADRFGKMRAFILALVGSFTINVAYVIFVFFQPDFRPSLWEIVFFGNLGLIFGMLKGVVTFPLMMEYVKRNRMGAASAGIGLFNAIFRNTLGLFVGVWLAWWSLWFLPQAGYNFTPTFQQELTEGELRSKLEQAGFGAEDLILRPVHQYGVDGETSMRWWIHRDTEKAHELLTERKDLKNKIGSLEPKLDSPFTDEEEARAIEAELDAAEARLEEIEETLMAGSRELYDAILPTLEADLFQPGAQILAAELQDRRLVLELQSIERLTEENIEELERVLAAPEHALEPSNDDSSASRFRPRIEVENLEGERHGFRVTMELDPRFLALYRAGIEAGLEADFSYSSSAAILSIARGVLGRAPEAFTLDEVAVDRGKQERAAYLFTVTPGPDSLQDAGTVLIEAYEQDLLFETSSLQREGNELRFQVVAAAVDESRNAPVDAAEVRERLDQLVEGGPAARSLLAQAYHRVVEAAAAAPVYVTVPRHSVEPAYEEREYEYFFASQTLQIATDVIGFLLVLLIIKLEKRGTIHRYGAEEDENR